MKIIDGDKFQKDYKQKVLKDKLSNLIEGIAISAIALLALIVGKTFFLKISIIVIPLMFLSFILRKLFIITKQSSSTEDRAGEIIQIILMAFFALYIIFNPIKTLAILVQLFGIFLLIKAFLIVLSSRSHIPIGTLMSGFLLTMFAEAIITTIYTIFFVILLLFGLSKITLALSQRKK